MNLTAIRLFLDAAQLGGFAPAARRNHCDPSSVSRAIAGLEAALGVRLFQRSTRTLALTEAGARFRARMAPLAAEMQDAITEARDDRAAPAGLLRIGASVAFGVVRLTPLLAKFRARFPEITLDLRLGDAPVDLIGEGLDLAIRHGSRPAGGVAARLAEVRYRVCASPDYLARAGGPKTPEELGDHPCLTVDLPGFRSRWRFRDPSGAVTEAEITPALTVTSPLALLEAARHGLGPTLLADWLSADDRGRGGLIDLFPAHDATATDFDSALWALTPDRAYRPQRVTLFLAALRRSLR